MQMPMILHRPGRVARRTAKRNQSKHGVCDIERIQAAAKHLGQVAAQYQPDAGARHAAALLAQALKGLEEALALLGAQAQAGVADGISTHPGSRPRPPGRPGRLPGCT